jgi:hypothetical protein
MTRFVPVSPARPVEICGSPQPLEDSHAESTGKGKLLSLFSLQAHTPQSLGEHPTGGSGLSQIDDVLVRMDIVAFGYDHVASLGRKISRNLTARLLEQDDKVPPML